MSDAIPKAGLGSKVKDKVAYFGSAFTAIRRNKRRSASMISGLILGISILAGILLYSTVLMNNVYYSIVEGSPYEVRFDFKGNVTDDQVEAIRQEFLNDPRVADAQLMYGNARQVTVQSGGSYSVYTMAYLEGEVRGQANETYFGEVNIISEEFYNSPIGKNLQDLYISSPGDLFDNSSQFYNGVVIDENLALAGKLQQGDVLEELRINVQAIDPDDYFGSGYKASIVFENVKVAGVVGASSGDASAGLFDVINFQEGLIVVPETLLQSNQTFLKTLKDEEMRYCVLKIDETQFDLTNPSGVNSDINQLINSFEKSHQDVLVGSNMVAAQLLPFQVMSIFIFFFDAVLTIPVAILSVYLLGFGIDLSLYERKYQVGILKTQGASPKQIKRKILTETFLLAIIGMIFGYIVAIFGAWGIGTAKGFMQWDQYALEKLPEFFVFDEVAFFLVGGLVSLFLFIMVNGKANTFIEMEVTESVRRAEDTKKPNFFRRNHLDILLFVVGVLALLVAIIPERTGMKVDFGPVQFMVSVFGPVCFWIGGGALTARLVVFLPTRTDPIIKRIGFLRDVSVLIKGNIFRKSGDIPRLALIIALTVSFSILAVVQGVSGEVHQQRLVEWDVGADVQVSTTLNYSTFWIQEMKQSHNAVDKVMATTSISGEILNDVVTAETIDASIYGSFLWHSDAFPDGQNRDVLLGEMATDPTNTVIVGVSLLEEKALEIGETIAFQLSVNHWNGTSFAYGSFSRDLKIIGSFDHAPGSIGGDRILLDNSLIYDLSNVTNSPANALIQTVSTDTNVVSASKYFVSLKEGANPTEVTETLLGNDWVIRARSLEGEIQKNNEIQQMDFGIPGLLTADFLISLLAATLATFIFMSILMEKRKKEFAIMRSYGASKAQVYKVVFSETISLLLTALLWGLVVGAGLAYLFNGFFEFLDVFVTPVNVLSNYQIERRLIYDWVMLFFTLFLTFVAMLVATFLSVRSALKSKISTVVRHL